MGLTPMDRGYVMVAERHAKFVEDHPDNSVEHIVSNFAFEPGTMTGFVVVTTNVWKVYGDRVKGNPPNATANASMPIPGPTSFTKNSEVENAETSALGRALAMLGYHPKTTMASDDEIRMKSKVMEGLAAGMDMPIEEAAEPTASGATASVKSKNLFYAEYKKMFGADADAMRKFVKAHTGRVSSKNLTNSDVTKLLTAIRELKSGDYDGDF
jgi:hypothetical protein